MKAMSIDNLRVESMDKVCDQEKAGQRRLSLLVTTILFILIFVFGHSSDSQAETSTNLKIIVYGSTGRVGSRIVTEALSRGHSVTAVSRDSARVVQSHDNLLPVRGDILDRESVDELILDHDVVVISVRGRVGNSRDPEQTVQRVGAEVLVDAMRAIGDEAPRIIYVGGAGSLYVEPGVVYADSIPRIARLMMPRSVRQEIGGHLLTLDYLRGVEDVRWTYVSPPIKFGPGERTGVYRVGGDQMLMDEDGRSSISMEDFSVALIDEAENGEFIGQRFSVAY